MTVTDRYDVSVIPFFLLHVVAIAGVALLGFSWQGVLLCGALYVVRMFGITAGFHRYFAHRAYRTGRGFQFILALLGTLSVQKGVLWWAAHHRHHHRWSDTDKDIHSPRRRGLIWSHMGWFLSRTYDATDYDQIRDFARFPELVWLNRYHALVNAAFAAVLFAVGGVEAFVWGFAVSTVVLWHGTFTINSLTHIIGSRRYETGDDSRNSFILALITLGEGWHNNHHYYQSTANQGFFWWEIDISYYVLRTLSLFRIIYDLRTPSERVLRGELRGPAVVLEQRNRAHDLKGASSEVPRAA